jgi:hypothetical protein
MAFRNQQYLRRQVAQYPHDNFSIRQGANG